MERYVGLDAHAQSCTLGVMSAGGRRLKSSVVETNGRALVEAVKGIGGRVHVCLEEGTQSAWLYELLKPHAAEVVVAVAPERKGPKDDQRDAWARANELRTGAIETRVFKAPEHLAGLRSAVRAYGFAVTDVVRAKNRLKSVFLSRGISTDASVYHPTKRSSWLKKLPSPHRELAEWLGRQLDQLEPLRDEAEGLLQAEAKRHPIIRKLAHGSWHGSDPDGAGGGDRGDAGAVSDAAAVLELQRPGDRDAILRGLGSGQDWEVGSCTTRAGARAEPKATASSEGGVQGGGDDGDRAACRRPTPCRLRADGAVRDQADAGEADAGPEDCSDGAVDVEAPGGLRPEATPPDAVAEVARSIEAKGSGEASDAAARERFGGEHPLVSWRPGRDGKARDEGYAPSECRPKRWPTKALSGAWHPYCSGGLPVLLYAQRRVRPDCTPQHQRSGMTPTDSSARSGARRHGLSWRTTICPLQELARAAGWTILLTTHFSGADEARLEVGRGMVGGALPRSGCHRVGPCVLARFAAYPRCSTT